MATTKVSGKIYCILYERSVRASVQVPHSSTLSRIVKSKSDDLNNKSIQSEEQSSLIPIINPSDLVGRSFLLNGNENGERFRVKIIESIKYHDEKVDKYPDNMNFVCSVNNDLQ